MAKSGQRPRGAGRLHLHDVALRLFAQHGIEGTSLQAIADEMNVSKAAVYYHYKTKDELVLGILAPLTGDVAAMVERIRAHRSRHARLEELVTSVVALAIDNHERFAVLLRDPAVGVALRNHALSKGWDDLKELIGDVEGDMSTRVAFSIFVTGLLGPLGDPELADLCRDTLREALVDSGRRLLHIRRRPAAVVDKEPAEAVPVHTCV
jgi:AcrR family transcriptional regulator